MTTWEEQRRRLREAIRSRWVVYGVIFVPIIVCFGLTINLHLLWVLPLAMALLAGCVYLICMSETLQLISTWIFWLYVAYAVARLVFGFVKDSLAN